MLIIFQPTFAGAIDADVASQVSKGISEWRLMNSGDAENKSEVKTDIAEKPDFGYRTIADLKGQLRPGTMEGVLALTVDGSVEEWEQKNLDNLIRLVPQVSEGFKSPPSNHPLLTYPLRKLQDSFDNVYFVKNTALPDVAAFYGIRNSQTNKTSLFMIYNPTNYNTYATPTIATGHEAAEVIAALERPQGGPPHYRTFIREGVPINTINISNPAHAKAIGAEQDLFFKAKKFDKLDYAGQRNMMMDEAFEYAEWKQARISSAPNIINQPAGSVGSFSSSFKSSDFIGSFKGNSSSLLSNKLAGNSQAGLNLKKIDLPNISKSSNMAEGTSALDGRTMMWGLLRLPVLKSAVRQNPNAYTTPPYSDPVLAYPLNQLRNGYDKVYFVTDTHLPDGAAFHPYIENGKKIGMMVFNPNISNSYYTPGLKIAHETAEGMAMVEPYHGIPNHKMLFIRNGVPQLINDNAHGNAVKTEQQYILDKKGWDTYGVKMQERISQSLGYGPYKGPDNPASNPTIRSMQMEYELQHQEWLQKQRLSPVSASNILSNQPAFKSSDLSNFSYGNFDVNKTIGRDLSFNKQPIMTNSPVLSVTKIPEISKFTAPTFTISQTNLDKWRTSSEPFYKFATVNSPTIHTSYSLPSTFSSSLSSSYMTSSQISNISKAATAQNNIFNSSSFSNWNSMANNYSLFNTYNRFSTMPGISNFSLSSPKFNSFSTSFSNISTPKVSTPTFSTPSIPSFNNSLRRRY
jgi:hypothetical protein